MYFLKDMKNIKGFKKEFDDLVLEIKERYKRTSSATLNENLQCFNFNNL